MVDHEGLWAIVEWLWSIVGCLRSTVEGQRSVEPKSSLCSESGRGPSELVRARSSQFYIVSLTFTWLTRRRNRLGTFV